MQTQPLELFFWILLAVGGAVLYLLPTIVAFRSHHPRTIVIAFLNIVLAWTLIAWVVLLAWAVNTDLFLRTTDAEKHPSI